VSATIHRRMPRLYRALALTAVLLGPAVAHAGDVKFGNEPLEVNDAGKLTDAGKKAATETLKSVPGEEEWPIHVWAQIDNGGPGPLYIEFWGKLPDGKPYLTFRHEHAGYGGEKYVSLSFELSGNLGFNKGKTYNVKAVQVSPKGKEVVLANGKVTLEFTARIRTRSTPSRRTKEARPKVDRRPSTPRGRRVARSGASRRGSRSRFCCSRRGPFAYADAHSRAEGRFQRGKRKFCGQTRDFAAALRPFCRW
jgi:hypothetical protein